jgi:hypothetical protein
VSKNVFLSHLFIKTNILPRQARDKHREDFVCSLVRTGSQPVFGVTGLLWPISCHQKPPIGTTFLISAAFDSWYLLRAIKLSEIDPQTDQGQIEAFGWRVATI